MIDPKALEPKEANNKLCKSNLHTTMQLQRPRLLFFCVFAMGLLCLHSIIFTTQRSSFCPSRAHVQEQLVGGAVSRARKPVRV